MQTPPSIILLLKSDYVIDNSLRNRTGDADIGEIIWKRLLVPVVFPLW